MIITRSPSIDIKVLLPKSQSRQHQPAQPQLTSAKNVTTTVLSANLRPASDLSAFCAASEVSYLMKILPTPADCLLPPLGRGILSSSTLPYFSHSSFTSAQISANVQSVRRGGEEKTNMSTYRRIPRHPLVPRPSPC